MKWLPQSQLPPSSIPGWCDGVSCPMFRDGRCVAAGLCLGDVKRCPLAREIDRERWCRKHDKG